MPAGGRAARSGVRGAFVVQPIQAQDNLVQPIGAGQFRADMGQRRTIQIRRMARENQGDRAFLRQGVKLRLDLRKVRFIQALKCADQAGLGEVAHSIADCGFGEAAERLRRLRNTSPS